MQHIELNKYISFAKCKDISLICQPLISNTPIKVIEYSRVYLDGSRLELSNDQSRAKNAIITCSNIMKHLYTPALLPKHQRYLLMTPWVTNIDNSASTILMDRISTQRERYGIDNEFRIIITHPQYTEMFHFYSELNTTNMENFYLNNTHILEQFIIYFLDAAHKIIQEADKNRIIKPWRNSQSSIVILDEYNKITETTNHDPLSSKIPPIQFNVKKFHFQINSIDVYLTKREVDCMLQIMQNKSNKEIAANLFLSIRTVETHISSLLNKTNNNSRRDLILFFSNNGLARLLPHD